MDKRVRDAIAAQGMEQSRIVFLDALLKLRQICCDPRLLSLEEAQGLKSAKLDYLGELLTTLREEGRRVLLFSQFTTMLKLIGEKLDQLGIGYIKLTGASKDRGGLVKKFQDGNVPLFLISLKAGGTGLNLTAARHRHPLRPVVEPRRRSPGHRPRLPHRPDQARLCSQNSSAPIPWRSAFRNYRPTNRNLRTISWPAPTKSPHRMKTP